MPDNRPGVRVRPVLKAYQQVADQLREAISDGTLLPGQRLPSENVLAREFGVSRATVREALRVLAAHNLIRTAKGADGGSYVTLPTIDHISEFMRANINLLTESRNVSLQEFLEARELLEVPAARLAAERGTREDVERLRATIPSAPLELGTEQQFTFNERFHSTIVDCSRNTLLLISAQPVFSVLQRNLDRSHLGQRFHRTINDDHRRIADAVEAKDAQAAAEEMSRHLQWLRGYYEKAWRHSRRDPHEERPAERN
jgi:DNA-binding FadR family transcriptional regulator